MSVCLSLLSLEDRSTPATFTVNAITDTGAGSGNSGDLRYCIAQANANPGDDTIAFDATVFASSQTITLSGTQLSITDTTGKTTITGSAAGVTISGNNASRVFEIVSGASAELSLLTITGGNASFGGGLRNLGTASLANCTVTGNTAIFGGGVYSRLSGGGTRTLSLTNCTVSGNTATSVGGGVYNSATGGTAVATLTNCTVSGNAANFGGGVSNNAAGGTATLFLVNCTISENTAPNGGGVYSVVSGSGTAEVTLTNTIVAQNTSDGDTPSDIGSFGGTVVGSNNLIGDAATAGGLVNGVNRNLVGVANPGLSALGNYGGPTQTIALLLGSPAIDAGTPIVAPATDARGIGRVGGVDIGAFESRGFTLTVVGGDGQSATVNTAFSRPLAVMLTANDPGIPVDGAQVTFLAPPNGASALIAGKSATIADGTATITATANSTPGTYTVTAGVPGVLGTVSFTLTNTLPPSPALPGIAQIFAVGAGAGGGPHVKAFDSGGVERFSFYAYGPEFSGGVHVATGDVNGDGVEDIVTGAGAGGGPHVKVFDGVTGAEIASFFAYDAAGRLGVHVAAADLDGNGIAEIVTGAGAGGGPHVKAFRWADLAEIASFFAFDPTSRSGVTVSGQPGFLVAGMGAGQATEVRVFRFADLAQVAAFFPFGAEFLGSVSLAAGNGLVAVGAGSGGSPTASVFTLEGQPVASFAPFDPAFVGGVSVAALGGANSQLVVGAGPGGTPRVRTFDVTGTETASFLAFEPTFDAGIFVG